jgi:hypothetical protein
MQDATKKHPDGSILSHLYMACEDFILSNWVQFLTESFSLEHVSLHFDGVRISKVPGVSVEDICRRSEYHIEQRTGFKVRIREKKHRQVLQLLEASAKETASPLFEDGHFLRQPGNCILHGLAVLDRANLVEKVLSSSDSSRPENAYMQQRKSRTYEQAAKLWSCQLNPVVLRYEDMPTGQFLLHTENGACPHCVAVDRVAARNGSIKEVTVWDVDAVRKFDDETFCQCLRDGVDHGTCVIFELSSPSDDTRRRLALSAAGHSSAEELAETDVDADDAAAILVIDSDTEEEPETGPLGSDEFQWLDEAGQVTVEESLLQTLAGEVSGYLAAARAGKIRKVRNAFPCPACPFRTFNRSDRLGHHMQKHHTSRCLA